MAKDFKPILKTYRKVNNLAIRFFVFIVIVVLIIIGVNMPFNNNQITEDNSISDNVSGDETKTNGEEIEQKSTSGDEKVDMEVTTVVQAAENEDVDNKRVIDPSKPMVALTFDDGPNPISTPRILDVLENNNVVATFFDLGKLIERFPDIVRREEEIGCDVGCHSYQHKNLTKISEQELIEDVKKTEVIFGKVLGHGISLYRPPYGNINDNVKKHLDYPIITWNVDSLDWKTRDKDSIISQIRKTENLDGHIVLMHSIYGTTADAVEVLVPELIEQGYQLVTVTELAQYKGNVSLEKKEIYRGF